MARIKAEEVLKVFTTILVVNLLFATLLYPWVTDEDIENLPTDPVDRWLTLFFFGVTSFATIGFGEFGSVRVKSRRLKILIIVYILLAISGAASFFFDF
jgi:hypothetical protein